MKLKKYKKKLDTFLLSRPEEYETITERDIKKATEILAKYKDGKRNLEERIVQDELWWELRHWEAIKKGKQVSEAKMPEVTSAWLFNALLNKHADAMDNMPEPIVLPREQSDSDSAKILTSVLPVIMEYNDFEDTYSLNWWEKLKHGTAAYGIFWNTDKENGLGDIDIKSIDLLKIFWEPGIQNIQDSKNLFIVDLWDNDDLISTYPQLKNIRSSRTVDVKQYIYDDTIDVTNKSVVVDWYYKVKAPGGKTLVHYVKYVGDTLLYASENDPEYRERGFYDHGKYPIVLDCLFPEKGTPVGFGYVAICKEPQLYIDKLSGNILENAMMNTKKRFFVSDSTNINVDEFLDWNNPIVTVQGDISDSRIKEIVCQPLSGIYIDVVNSKINEMKETTGNRDVNSGASKGVTAASAIAALQEAGNKTSRDIIAASYRSYAEIGRFVIELIRQFYNETRVFRIVGANGFEFRDVSNSGMTEQEIGTDSFGTALIRVPIFDLKIKAQRKNPFSRMEENERAKEFYRLGFFNPTNAQQSLSCLKMMNFEGSDELREILSEGDTYVNLIKKLREENDQLRAILNIGTQKSDEKIQPEESVSYAKKQIQGATPMLNKMVSRSVK